MGTGLAKSWTYIVITGLRGHTSNGRWRLSSSSSSVDICNTAAGLQAASPVQAWQ